MRTLEVQLPLFHPSQRDVHDDPARFKVVAGGRRWGKNTLGVVLCLETAARGGHAWWIAFTFPVASIGWRLITHLAKQIPFTTIREGDRMVLFPGEGWVQVKSSDDPDSLRGEGLDLAVFDECAFQVEEAWTEAALAPKKPIVGSFPACCARAASGHAAAAPIVAMNSRRFIIRSPRRRARAALVEF